MKACQKDLSELSSNSLILAQDKVVLETNRLLLAENINVKTLADLNGSSLLGSFVCTPSWKLLSLTGIVLKAYVLITVISNVV